jgi:AhpD family alkylhydroperoxidase
MSEVYKMGLPLRSPEDADPRVAGPLQAAQKGMGMVPNMYAAMANLPALLDTYNAGYAAFRAEAGFTPIEQEVIFLTVSRANACQYCMAAHSFVADMMSKVPTEVTDAIRDDRPIAEPKLEALRIFTRTMVERRGNPSPAEVQKFIAAGFNEINLLGLILAISVKIISNYSNHLFHTEIDPAFASRAWSEPLSA